MLKYSINLLFIAVFQNFSVSLQRKEIIFLKNTEIRYNYEHYYSEKQKIGTTNASWWHITDSSCWK